MVMILGSTSTTCSNGCRCIRTIASTNCCHIGGPRLAEQRDHDRSIASTWDGQTLRFGTAPLTLDQWFVCAAIASTVLWSGELRELASRARRKAQGAGRQLDSTCAPLDHSPDASATLQERSKADSLPPRRGIGFTDFGPENARVGATSLSLRLLGFLLPQGPDEPT